MNVHFKHQAYQADASPRSVMGSSYGHRNLGMRKPAAAFPEPARWPGTTQAFPLPRPPPPLRALSRDDGFDNTPRINVEQILKPLSPAT